MATSITDVISYTVEDWSDGDGSHSFGTLACRTRQQNDPSIGSGKHRASMLAFEGGSARQDFTGSTAGRGSGKTAPIDTSPCRSAGLFKTEHLSTKQASRRRPSGVCNHAAWSQDRQRYEDRGTSDRIVLAGRRTVTDDDRGGVR